ncbi:MAG: type II toxin-antitoxin system RelE/ParE family toxin [Siphonobacter aquaeclarae]|nr:type II toxin-antitoxin system RelE/ParE family toxin [Siphonobacter aquaeclarae]
MQYRISNLAQQDLEDIWAYTEREWSLRQAERYVGGILAVFDSLSDGDVVSKSADHIRSGYRKVLYGKHYIFYRIGADQIMEIIRVLHVQMDPEQHF